MHATLRRLHSHNHHFGNPSQLGWANGHKLCSSVPVASPPRCKAFKCATKAKLDRDLADSGTEETHSPLPTVGEPVNSLGTQISGTSEISLSIVLDEIIDAQFWKQVSQFDSLSNYVEHSHFSGSKHPFIPPCIHLSIAVQSRLPNHQMDTQ